MSEQAFRKIDKLSAWDRHWIIRKGQKIVESACEQRAAQSLVNWPPGASAFSRLETVSRESLNVHAAAAIAAIVEYVHHAGGECWEVLDMAARAHGWPLMVDPDESEQA